MAGRRKLSDEEVARLRELADDGWSPLELSEEFAISREHAGRLVRQAQRPLIAGMDAEAVRRVGVSAALEAYLAEAEVDLAAAVLAATARVVAAKLDAAAASESAASAGAVPRLAGEVAVVLDRLRAGLAAEPEPDELDLLRQRRHARLLAAAIATRTESA